MDEAIDEVENIRRVRDEVLPIRRDIINLCSRAIKNVHEKEFKEAREKQEEIEEKLSKVEEKLQKYPFFQKKTMKTPYQEYVELLVLKSQIAGEELPEIDVPPEPYLLGVLDAIGEMKRHALDLVIEGKTDKAVQIFDRMEEVYGELRGETFPDSIVPGFRRKQDQGKRTIQSLHSTLAEASFKA